MSKEIKPRICKVICETYKDGTVIAKSLDFKGAIAVADSIEEATKKIEELIDLNLMCKEFEEDPDPDDLPIQTTEIEFEFLS